jgi:hypothetical protein
MGNYYRRNLGEVDKFTQSGLGLGWTASERSKES